MKEILIKSLMIFGAIMIDLGILSLCLWLISWSFPIAFSMSFVCSVWGAYMLLKWVYKNFKE